MKQVSAYFDYAATTPMHPAVRAAMKPFETTVFANPGSSHRYGREARRGVDQARVAAATFLNCTANEIIFTSGATEANNLATLGMVSPGDHVICSVIEHASVLEPLALLQSRGVSVTHVPVTNEGLVTIESVAAAVRPETRLVSIMYVNNEIGTIQPIRAIGEFLHQVNAQRATKKLPPIYFHVDAVQAVSSCPMDVRMLGVDLLSLSGHKAYGPRGVGLLYRKNGTPLHSIFSGGDQEFGVRPGTVNTPAIVGLGKALALVSTYDHATVKTFGGAIIASIQKIPNSRINGSLEYRVAGNVHASFGHIDNQSLLFALDQAGIAASAGATCTTGAVVSSHVLTALAMPPEYASAGIRISFGQYTTKKEVAYLIKTLPTIVSRLRTR